MRPTARYMCLRAHVAEDREGAEERAHLILRKRRRRPLTHAGGSRGAANLLCRRSIRLSAASRRPAKRLLPTRSASTMETEHASATPASSSAITQSPAGGGTPRLGVPTPPRAGGT